MLLQRFMRNSLQLLKEEARAKSRPLSVGVLQTQQKVHKNYMYIKYFSVCAWLY